MGGLVRCNDCQTDPLTPGHYCACCGRKLSLEERGASESAPAAVEEHCANHCAPDDEGAPVARCGSCGGPCPEGDLCESCRQAFATLLPNVEPESAKVGPVKTEAEKIAAARATAAQVVADRAAAAQAAAAKAAAARSERALYAGALNPAVASPRVIAPVRPHRRSRSMVLATAIFVIVAAIGVVQGARWLHPQTAHEGQPAQPTPVPDKVTTVERRTTPVKEVAKIRHPTTTPAQAAASARSIPAKQATRAVASIPATEAPRPAAVPPPQVSMVAERRESIAPVEPTGRLFERRDVDEPPQVATRIAPHVPADLRARSVGDIVIVHVLVSQTGHPFRISLLRGSKSGRSLDDAVVVAVNQWTFSPARKRGEAVSCWLNIGVPLSQAN
jgi:TonB family protein